MKLYGTSVLNVPVSEIGVPAGVKQCMQVELLTEACGSGRQAHQLTKC